MRGKGRSKGDAPNNRRNSFGTIEHHLLSTVCKEPRSSAEISSITSTNSHLHKSRPRVPDESVPLRPASCAAPAFIYAPAEVTRRRRSLPRASTWRGSSRSPNEGVPLAARPVSRRLCQSLKPLDARLFVGSYANKEPNISDEPSTGFWGPRPMFVP